jgi:hypothetical protein
MTELTTETRNATLADLAELLQQQQTRKVDMVVPATKMRAVNGEIVVKGADPLLTETGVDVVDGTYRTTDVFEEGLSGKLNIPREYLRRMRLTRTDLWDANVNGWLHGRRPLIRNSTDGSGFETVRPGVDPDPRAFLLRTFRGEDGTGIARALLSDQYGFVDHLDALTAALDGVKEAGVEVNIESCDLSDRRMYVRVVAEQVNALAPTLLRHYRSPFNHNSGTDNPVVFAGFVISNSETGNGAWSITPRLVVMVCRNGMTINADAIRGVHLGQRLDEGIIRWSEDTKRKQLELMKAKTADVVRTALDVDYLQAKIEEIENKADHKLTSHADEAVKTVTNRLKFPEHVRDAVLQHFIEAGDTTAGGVMQAVTSAAQVVESPDMSSEMEGKALEALTLASYL